MSTTALRVAAAIVVALEGIGLAALAVWQLSALAQGDTASATTAIALLVLTVVGAGAVLAFAGAIIRGVSWGRSGGIVAQLLILAVALGAATGSYADPAVAAAVAAPGVVGLVLLVLLARRGAPPRER